jgi:uncharacterized lipoprotein YmbA
MSAVTGCAAPPQTNYRLAAVPGAPHQSGDIAVSVRSISIPGYLDVTSIVKPGGAYEVNSFNNAVWAEPFAEMLQAVLVSDLAQRLPAANIFSTGAIGAPPDRTVEANVQRFDFDPDGTINLTVQFGVKSGGADSAWTIAKFHATAAPQNAQADAIAAAMSSLWGLAADQLASMIV